MGKNCTGQDCEELPIQMLNTYLEAKRVFQNKKTTNIFKKILPYILQFLLLWLHFIWIFTRCRSNKVQVRVSQRPAKG
jgi:hypothetical protein